MPPPQTPTRKGAWRAVANAPRGVEEDHAHRTRRRLVPNISPTPQTTLHLLSLGGPCTLISSRRNSTACADAPLGFVYVAQCRKHLRANANRRQKPRRLIHKEHVSQRCTMCSRTLESAYLKRTYYDAALVDHTPVRAGRTHK